MRKLILMTFLIACSACLSLGQTPADYPKNEFFAGYSYHSADINTLTIDPHRTSQNGINLEYSRSITRNIRFTGDVSAHFKRLSQQTGGGVFESKRDQYYFLGGVQYSAPNKNLVTPFVHALFGASLFRGFTTNSTPTGNVFTVDDATSFAMALGGGLDVRASDRISIRIVQADYTPTFFGSGRQDNIRLSFGIVFKR
jgi:opacity protein-like surface antigen